MRKWIISALLCAVLCFLTGCTHTPALKERLIVRCVGIDRTETGYRLSIDGFQVKGVESGEENMGESIFLQTEGETLTRAVENLQKIIGRSPFFSHNQAILLGAETAKEGTEDIFRFFNGNYQSSPDVPIFLAETTAEDLFSAGDLMELLGQNDTAPAVYQLGETFLTTSAGVCVPRIITGEDEALSFSGYGMFKEGRLIDLLTPEEELGYRAMKKDVQTLWVDDVQTEVRFTAMETYLHCEEDRPTPTVSVRLNLRGEIVDEISGLGTILSSEDFREATEQCEQELSHAVNAVLEGSAWDYGVDLFDLSAKLERGTEDFSDLTAAEKEAILRTCNFDVTVAVVLRSKTAALGED